MEERDVTQEDEDDEDGIGGGGGTPRKIGCAARFPKTLPYL